MREIFLFICLIIGITYILHFFSLEHSGRFRRLSAKTDLNTGEIIETTNGSIPEVSCPLGHYRPLGSTILRRITGQRQDGCRPCPRGRYGDKMGLTHPSCSGLCPVGTYGDEVGLKSIKECKLCPPGSHGTRSGLTTSSCSGLCPKGSYSDTFGAKACKKCPPHYKMWQCIDE